MNVLDFCDAFKQGLIKVDTNYQRTDKIWPLQAKQYLIESVILGYPIPKLFLHQQIDIKTKKSIKYVVDGQQRSKALVEYFDGAFSLSKKSEIEGLAGKAFEDLDESLQNAFLTYSLPIDLFVTASREEIIETFRRINSYTVPLNAEERRHADYQGNMKWFIYSVAKHYSERFAAIGTFSDKHLSRMQDFKFYSELVLYILTSDLVTTSKAVLDKLYAKYNDDFEEADAVIESLTSGLLTVLSWDWLKGMSIVKPHIMQILIYSIIVNEGRPFKPDNEVKEFISSLSDAVANHSSDEYKDFVNAASKTTNDKARKAVMLEILANGIFVDADS